MKNMKRMLGLLLSLLMLVSVTSVAFAEGESGSSNTCTITINNDKTGHTYEAYQIFTGTPYEIKNAENKVIGKGLTDICWGANNTEKKTGALTQAEVTGLDTTNLASYVDFTTTATATSTYTAGKYVISGLVPGYYLVRDKADTLNGVHDSHTAFILEVVETSEVTPKSAKPTVDKLVWDEPNDAEEGHTEGWGETADHAINETFRFKLIATLPNDDNFKYYDKYKVIFTDTMSGGITFDGIESVQIVVGETKTSVPSYDCTATKGQVGGEWQLTIEDITLNKTVALTGGAAVEVVYKAYLNESAKVNGATENKNTVYLEYSNNPNVGGAASMGKTAEDHVWVFTYTAENTKVDGTQKPLAGAGFRLYTDEACSNEFQLIFDEALKAYRPVKGEEDGVEMTSAETTGKFNIVGLDAGTYYLKETSVPVGYNSCANVKIVIAATHAENVDKISATVDFSNSTNKTNTIVNNAGIQLPETGGMGTTVLYVAGGVLVLAAVVLLVTKKRMSDKQ